MDIFPTALNQLTETLGPVFYKLLYMSLTAAGLGLIILLIRRIADQKIAPGWKMILWGLVLAALLVPYRPQSGLALLPASLEIQNSNYQTQYEEVSNDIHLIGQAGQMTSDDVKTVDTLKAQQNSLYLKALVFDVIVPIIWLVGLFATGLYLILGRVMLFVKLGRHTLPRQARYDRILQECKETLGITSGVTPVVQDYIASPALLGIFRIKIILPEYADELEDKNLRYIFLHELSHFKRKDMLLNHLLLVLQTVYWFNPLVWLLFRYFREDMELMNDTYVLNHIRPENTKEYARSLVKILGRSQRVHGTPKLLCMVDGKGNMERRITMIKLADFFKKHKIIIAVVCVAIIGILGSIFLTQVQYAVYEGENYSFRYPISWIRIDENMTQDDMRSINEITSVDQQWIDEMLGFYNVIFIDPARSTEENLTILSVYRQRWLWPNDTEEASDRTKEFYQASYGETRDSFSFLEEPHIKKIGEYDFNITAVLLDNEVATYQAIMDYDRSSNVYLFTYTTRTGSIDTQTEKTLEKILSTVEIIE